jgi:hypothetical protein
MTSNTIPSQREAVSAADAPNLNRPTQGSGGGADVTQADREAAADWLLVVKGFEQAAGTIRRGEDDGDYSVQAFARHRLSSTPSNTQGALEADTLRSVVGEALEMAFDISADDPANHAGIERMVEAIAALKSGEAGHAPWSSDDEQAIHEKAGSILARAIEEMEAIEPNPFAWINRNAALRAIIHLIEPDSRKAFGQSGGRP